jgi:hypothetical protein
MKINSLTLRHVVAFVCKYGFHCAYQQGVFTTYGGMLAAYGLLGLVIWALSIFFAL